MISLLIPLLFWSAGVSDVAPTKPPELEEFLKGVTARQSVIHSISYSYTRTVTAPGNDSPNELRVLNFHGTSFAANNLYYNEEFTEEKKLTSIYTFNGEVHFNRPDDKKHYIAVSRLPGAFPPPSGGDPWHGIEGVTFLIMTKPDFFSQIEVKKMREDNEDILKIVGHKDLSYPGRDTIHTTSTLRYSLATKLLLSDHVLENGREAGVYRLLKSARLQVDGEILFVPLQSEKIFHRNNGTLESKYQYEVDEASLKVNQPIDSGMFTLKTRDDDSVLDMGFDDAHRNRGEKSDLDKDGPKTRITPSVAPGNGSVPRKPESKAIWITPLAGVSVIVLGAAVLIAKRRRNG